MLRSRLQHQIHNQLQATPPRRLAIVPPLPRCTATTPLALPDCGPATPLTPGGVDCSTMPSSSSSAGAAICSPHPSSNCSPYPVSNCSPHPAMSSNCSPHPATPGGGGAHCSPHPPTSQRATSCSPHPYTPGGVPSHSAVGSGNQDQLSAPKMCSAPLDKHHGSGLSLLGSQGQTLLQDLLDLDP